MGTYEPTTKDDKCIFCEIAGGRMQTPGVFWENQTHMAFLSIDPNTEGFSCVIPKEHYGSDIMKMDDEALKALIVASKHVAGILERAFDDVGRVGVIMEGTGINHAHVKLVPMHGTEFLKNGNWRQVLSEKEIWFDTYEGWIASAGGPMADTEQLRILAEKLKHDTVR